MTVKNESERLWSCHNKQAYPTFSWRGLRKMTNYLSKGSQEIRTWYLLNTTQEGVPEGAGQAVA
jgi:uncharacterized protein with HEPN domain